MAKAKDGSKDVWKPVALLVVLNAFVGGMVGLERTVLPLLAEDEFGVASAAAVASFVATFGVAKAIVNLFAGHLSDRWGRRQLLLAGWLAGLPVPLILLWAPSWGWVIAANVLLGLNQGLAWSMTVLMKIDLVEPAQRGLVVGLNEAAGYGGLALVAAATGFVADRYALTPEPFYLGVGLAVLGLVLAWFVGETRPRRAAGQDIGEGLGLLEVLRRSSVDDLTLGLANLGGMVTNLKDGMLWGLLPLLLAGQGLGVDQVGVVVAAYPVVWGAGQLLSGPASDRWGRRELIVPGMLLQGLGVAGFAATNGYGFAIASALVVGAGTALVYPTLIALVSDRAPADWRGGALGVYRFWRDAGYAVGALGAGALADIVGLANTMYVVAGLAALVGVAIGTGSRTADRGHASSA